LNGTRGIAIKTFANDNGAPIPWTYTFAGLTISGSGNADTGFTGLTPGVFEVTGQMTSRGTLSFSLSGLSSNVPGYVVGNSVQSLEGPGSQVQCIGVSYFIRTGDTIPQTFRFKFTLDSTSTHSVC
jgi:hypothetical protein